MTNNNITKQDIQDILHELNEVKNQLDLVKVYVDICIDYVNMLEEGDKK